MAPKSVRPRLLIIVRDTRVADRRKADLNKRVPWLPVTIFGILRGFLRL